MTATSTTSPQPIDASCRLPLFALFGGSAAWLALGSVLGLLGSLRFHAPAMLADCAALSYGRVYPASQFLLVYGFCIPAGLAVGLWLLARLGRVELARPWLIAFGAKLWHLGVLVGSVAILAGETTGHELLEAPRYASVILFLGFLMMALWAFVTHTRRNEPALYPSQWFVLAALFWFPWIFTSATLLLQWFPVRGMAQAAVAWWFAGNLLNVWLPLAGLAASFYFLPKIAGRPLQSRYLALFVFLTLAIFGTWTGIPSGTALPAWMPALSNGAKMLSLVPFLAVALMVIRTCRGAGVVCRGGPFCYFKFGASSLVLVGCLMFLTACPVINRVTNFTWYAHGQRFLLIYGFFGMTMFAAAYSILPHIVGAGAICPNRVRAQFWLSMLGTLLLSIPLVIAGILQGLKLMKPEIAFLDALQASLMPFRISTLGEVLVIAGNLLFLFNVGYALIGHLRVVGKTAYAEAVAPLESVGVRS